jgi:hypothetical protein
MRDHPLRNNVGHLGNSNMMTPKTSHASLLANFVGASNDAILVNFVVHYQQIQGQPIATPTLSPTTFLRR